MKKLVILLVFLSFSRLSAQCIQPYIFNTEEEKQIRVQLHNIQNIIHKPFLNIKNKSDVLKLIKNNRLQNIDCNLDAIKPFVLNAANYYIGTQKKRDSLQKIIKTIDDYNNKITAFVNNRIKENKRVYNKNKAKIHFLIEIRNKRVVTKTNSVIKQLEAKINQYSKDEKKYANAIQKVKQLQEKNNNNSFCNFIKYERTLAYLYEKRFKEVLDKNTEKIAPILSSAATILKPHIKLIIAQTVNSKTAQEEIERLLTSNSSKPKSENWQAEIRRNTVFIYEKKNIENYIQFLVLEDEKGNPNYMISAINFNKNSTLLLWKINNEKLEKLPIKSIFSKKIAQLYSEEKILKIEMNERNHQLEIIKKENDQKSILKLNWNGKKLIDCQTLN